MAARALAGSLGDALSNAGHGLVSLLRVVAAVRLSRPRFPAPRTQRLLILGSGPSLNRSLGTADVERIRDLDLMCVNDFYKEESFAILRPPMLTIADPAYWDERCFDEYGGPLVAALRRVDWRLNLLLPERARGTRLYQSLREHHIDFTGFSTATVRGPDWLESALFEARLGMPRPQNVLVAAIALGIWAGYREIAVIGADHSWHQEIDVDDTNVVMASARHSYSSQVRPKPFLKPAGVWKYRDDQPLARSDVFTMKEILLAWAAMHDSYERLARLASRRAIRIYNCSAISFIDAFDRVDLGAFLDGTLAASQRSRPA
jgi:hypothetical protein